MSVKTQGTQLYFFDPASKKIMEVGCVESITGFSASVDQIEDTCLSSKDRTYKSGLRTPGTMQFNLRTDFREKDQLALVQLYQGDSESTTWFIGFSDGTDDPTLKDSSSNASSATLPNSRTFLQFEGYVSDFPFDFSQNTIVGSSLSVQMSGGYTVHPKS